MTIARREVPKILANCRQDQAEQLQQWAERPENADPEAPGLDSASSAFLFAAAMGDAVSWQSLIDRHPALAGLDVNDLPTVLDRLFA